MKQKNILWLLLALLLSCKSETDYPQTLELVSIIEEEFTVYTANNVQTEFDSSMISISALFDDVTVFQDSIVFCDDLRADLYGGFFGYRSIGYKLEQQSYAFSIGDLHTSDLTPQAQSILYAYWQGLNQELIEKLDNSISDEVNAFGDFKELEIPCFAYQYIDYVSDGKATIGKMVQGVLSQEHLNLIQENDTLIIKKYKLVYENKKP